MADLINRLVAEATPFDATKRIVRPDGEVRYVRCVGVPFLTAKNSKSTSAAPLTSPTTNS